MPAPPRTTVLPLEKTSNAKPKRGSQKIGVLPTPEFGMDLLSACQVKPGSGVVHVHCANLRYIDHACIKVIETWTERLERSGQVVNIEMEKLHLRYRARVSETVT